jgi:predicted nucleic acid-binding protein
MNILREPESNIVAVLDACILYSALARDLFLRLAKAKAYAPKWSEEIHKEWMDALTENRPEIAERIKNTRRLMGFHFKAAMVKDYENLIEDIKLTDLKDRHVVAVAIKAKAQFIVTDNTRHFPDSVLNPYGITALKPDRFAVHLFKSCPEQVKLGVQNMRLGLSNPPRNQQEHLDTLAEYGYKGLVGELAKFVKDL